MDWVERLNQAIAYIDKNLDGDISYEEISRITASPVALFQRFFVLATGITLAEYIRRRKLSCALDDLQGTDSKVIDIAVKYGYDSSDAFCVAFKRLYGLTPSQARNTDQTLKRYGRVFFTLTVSYVKGEKDMILLNIDNYRFLEPLFEGARIILTYLGETYTPEYIQGISGAAFKIAGGCPSRPTCVCDMWPAELFRLMGYEATEHPCADENGKDVSDIMIEAVKREIDRGRPALVWNAFTNAEWDVVCGYDEEAKQFVGRGSYTGSEDYAREPWDRTKFSEIVHPFGAVLLGKKISEFDSRAAELASLQRAVAHGRKTAGKDAQFYEYEGIQSYRKWAAIYGSKRADRQHADAYCCGIYGSVRRAAVAYLRMIAGKYDDAVAGHLREAASCFEHEAGFLSDAWPYLSWDSPWGVDEKRSKKVAPILAEAARWYEKGIVSLEKALECGGI